MNPVQKSPLEELRHTQDELHFERGVMFALRELSKKRSLETIFVESTDRIVFLEDKAERLRRGIHGTK